MHLSHPGKQPSHSETTTTREGLTLQKKVTHFCEERMMGYFVGDQKWLPQWVQPSVIRSDWVIFENVIHILLCSASSAAKKKKNQLHLLTLEIEWRKWSQSRNKWLIDYFRHVARPLKKWISLMFAAVLYWDRPLANGRSDSCVGAKAHSMASGAIWKLSRP